MLLLQATSAYLMQLELVQCVVMTQKTKYCFNAIRCTLNDSVWFRMPSSAPKTCQRPGRWTKTWQTRCAAVPFFIFSQHFPNDLQHHVLTPVFSILKNWNLVLLLQVTRDSQSVSIQAAMFLKLHATTHARNFHRVLPFCRTRKNQLQRYMGTTKMPLQVWEAMNLHSG